MAFFEGKEMTGGYGNGPDIISSCSVNVNKGEIVAILGPNGAGKSTAMKAMLGLLNLKSGKITIDGKDISKLSSKEQLELRSEIGGNIRALVDIAGKSIETISKKELKNLKLYTNFQNIKNDNLASASHY